jgi:methylated-DNA-[protein]-cysteine S-methyltransferase
MLLVYHQNMNYQAKIAVPFGILGIRCDDAALLAIDFLPSTVMPQRAEGAVAENACLQLHRYFQNPQAPFSIHLQLVGTPHQLKVWNAIANIPAGYTRSYGELAVELNSCAQAVGQACGANPFPVIIPCHRVVSKNSLGGFMKHGNGATLDIKRWLLEHERR